MGVTIKATMNKEVVAALIDQIEDFLEEKGVEIDNPDRDDDEGAAIIYGEDYDRLCNDFMSTLGNFGIRVVDTWEEISDKLAEEPVKKPVKGCELAREKNLKMARELWEEFGDVIVDDNECIENPWRAFAAGTSRYDIWHWFESFFGVSVAKDLMNVS